MAWYLVKHRDFTCFEFYNELFPVVCI